MDAFLQTVDVAPPANVAALVAGLSAGGYAEPEHLNMAEANEVLSVFPADGEGKLAPPDKSFLRRDSFVYEVAHDQVVCVGCHHIDLAALEAVQQGPTQWPHPLLRSDAHGRWHRGEGHL